MLTDEVTGGDRRTRGGAEGPLEPVQVDESEGHSTVFCPEKQSGPASICSGSRGHGSMNNVHDQFSSVAE